MPRNFAAPVCILLRQCGTAHTISCLARGAFLLANVYGRGR
jgi:hypothetical protein